MLIQYLKKYKILPRKLLNEAIVDFRKKLSLNDYNFINEDHPLIHKCKFKTIESIICNNDKLRKLVNIIINMYQSYDLKLISNLPIKIIIANDINNDYANYRSAYINQENRVKGFMTFNFNKTDDSFIYPYSYSSYEIHLEIPDSEDDLISILKHEIGHVLLHDNSIKLSDKLEECLIEYMYKFYSKKELMIDLKTFDKMNDINMQEDNYSFYVAGVCFIHYLIYTYFNSNANIDDIYINYN